MKKTGTALAGAPLAVEAIAARILFMRGQKVILDADLAALYGVQTRRLNEQVRRNADRFPARFHVRTVGCGVRRFDVAICDIKRQRRPLAFAEHRR